MAVKAKAEITLYKIISVDKVVRYYLLQSSTLAAPSKPADGAVIGSNWSKTEPSYTSGSTSTLYFVDQTVLSNGTLKYSEVSKSSSYEAAKEAWNKSNNAQKTADSANSKIDGLQVGGRNLILNSKGDKKAGFFKNFTVGDGFGEITLKSKKTYSNIDITAGFLLGCRDYTVDEQVTWSYDIMYTAWNFPVGTTRTEFWMGQRYTYAPSGETATGIWSNVTKYDLPVVGVDGCKLNKWYHVEKTVTIPTQASPNVGTAASIQFYNSNADVEASFTARIRNVKLERGNKATDWTPAPEDLETRVSDAETAISNNEKEIKLKASQDEVTAISDNLKVLTKTSTEFKQTVEGWQLNWDKLISTDNAEVASHQDYITFDKGDIILGESSNDLKLKITNDSIQFKGTSNTEVTPDSDATAWITGKTFHISDGEIQNSLKFGKLYLKPNNENNSVDLYYSDSESDVISGSYVRLGQTISMGNGMRSGFLKLNTGCIQMYPTTLADTIGNDNTGKFELHAGGSYPYIIFGDYNTNDEAKKEKGRYSVRIGGSNTVSGNCSVAIGYSSDVSGKNSTAIGHYLKNISDNQLLIGKYNISSDYPFIIGNGSSDTERSNALTVDWDGNITGKSLTSANALKLGFGSSNIFKPYFTKGDSITLTIYAVGYVTTGGKEVAMYVPLSRPIIAGGSVSVASVNGLTIRQNGKYLYSSSASNSVNPSSFRAAIVGSGCGVNIVATFGNTVNATVNDVCSITASIKITFS